jgi:hypothetical protein
MKSHLSTLMTDLAETAQRLNAESDAVSEVINSLESSLQALKIGLAVSLLRPFHVEPLPQLREGPLRETRHTLGWGRDPAGAWRLLVHSAEVTRFPQADSEGERFEDEEQVQSHVRPLAEVGRDLRVAALRVLPDLLKDLKREADQAIETMVATKRTLN